MLVLTRKTEECIRIGQDIVIKVVRIRGNSVRIGIEAPAEVAVRRGELAPKNHQVASAVAVASETTSDNELASAAG